MKLSSLAIRPGSEVDLSKFDADDNLGYKNKDDALGRLASDISDLGKLQEVLSAQAKYAVLIVFQGMDTAGKDGAVKHVMSGINPIGVNVYGFKRPSDEERAHDFLWRCEKVLPERGRIAIFNRSYYEDVLITRVHPELLGSRAPGKDFWKHRYEAINAFERHLHEEGTIVIKFFLHITKDEQRDRLRARIEDPDKQWKCSVYDLKERQFWDDYMRVYEKALARTSTGDAPWYVVPANHKYVARTAIAATIVGRLKELDLAYPPLDPAVAKELQEVGAQVLAD